MKNGGYNALPNCLPDIYMKSVSDVQYKVLECISRKTLGWWKRWDAIPLSQFEDMMGNSRPAIVRAIKVLKKSKLILCGKGQGRSASQYALNPGFDTFELMVNHFNQLSKLTSNAELLLVVKQINCYASVVVNEVNTQKTDLKHIKTTTEDEVVLTDRDRAISVLTERWKLPSSPSVGRVGRMVDSYGYSNLINAIDQSDPENKTWTGILNYVEKVAKNLAPKQPPKQLSEEEIAVTRLTRLVADYRSIDGNGRSRTGATLSAAINVMRPYAKWYSIIDNFGSIVGMEVDEYEALTNGGTR